MSVQSGFSSFPNFPTQTQLPVQNVSGTAILSSAFVGPEGRRSSKERSDAVQFYLMNVLRSSDTSVESRAALLEKVLASLELQGPSVLLAPAGYFGHDSISGSGRYSIPSGLFERTRALSYLESLQQRLPQELLLVVGLDWPDKQTIQILKKDEEPLVVTRHHSTPEERLSDFAGLKLFSLVCGEFMLSGQPTYRDGRYFDAGRDVGEHGIHVVLNPAHIEVKATQNVGADERRFPFQRAFRNISRAGAACFLAHHHPNELGEQAPWPKSNSYSTWGIFSGTGEDCDWMEHDGSDWTPYNQLVRVVSVP